MEIDNEEKEAPKDADLSTPDIHPSDAQREEPVDPVELVEPMDRPRDVAMAKRRPTWLRDTLQEAEKHAAPIGSFRESRRP